MLSMVLDVFSKLSEYELHITGIKGNELMLQQYANNHSNIHWHGQLPFNVYMELLHHITFQLSTRDINFPENQCNFPSKIIEALFHNRIIISTIHYPQIEGMKYFTVKPTKEEFHNGIRAIADLSDEELLRYANQGNVVERLFGVEVWNQAMAKIEE